MAAVAVALYLVPFVVALLARGRKTPHTWELALDVPVVFAVDLLGILVLALVVRLDWAILTSRVVWTALGGWAAVRRRLAWPRCLDLRATGIVGLSAAFGAQASLWLSRDWGIWDRRWHMPLVTSMEGQRVPFKNIYVEPGALHYHFSGDVHAAMFRALSFEHVSSGLALSMSHDVVYAILGAVIALLLVEKARPSAALVAFAVAAVLLHGPVMQKPAAGFKFTGHMYQNFLCVGFRPHLPLSGLMLVGLVAVVCARATRGSPRPWHVAAAMVPCASLLSITDETSLFVVLASLGVAWLVDGRLLGDRWWHGLAILGGMAAGAIVTNLVFQGSLAPGGPLQKIELVPGRIADIRNGAHELWDEEGRKQLAYDLFPFAAPAAGIVWAALAKPSRKLLALAALACVAVVLSTTMATKLRINGTEGVEAERFFVAVFFVVLVVALWLLPQMPRWSVSTALVIVGPAASIFFTFWWFRSAAAEVLSGSESNHHLLTVNLMNVDCRKDADARLGDVPEVTYVDESVWYYYTACRGVFEAGLTEPPWPVKIKSAFETPMHLTEFDKIAPKDATVPAVCWKNDGHNDRVCTRLRQTNECVPEGDAFLRCPFPPDIRRELLAHR
jgi:hypothetical protein